MIGIGVDIGGTFVKLYVMNERGEIIRKEKMETSYEHGAEGFLRRIAAFVNQIKTQYPDQKVAVGVGGGLILNKELYQGSNGTAGEIGHTKIASTKTGPQCGCGARGCLEAFVGTIGIRRRVMEGILQHPQSILAQMVQKEQDFKIELVSRAAEQGCPLALKIWEDTGFFLGVGIANVVLVLDVDTVVLTGGVSGAAKYFLPAAENVLHHQQIQTPFKKVRLMVSRDPNIGGVGAAMYAIDQELKK